MYYLRDFNDFIMVQVHVQRKIAEIGKYIVHERHIVQNKDGTLIPTADATKIK